MKLKEILRPTLTLFILCLLTTALLAGTNLLTKDTIAAQIVAAEEASRKVVLPQGETFEATDNYCTAYDSDGDVAGYVFTTEAKGYGGTIKVMTGISVNGTVVGVTILSHSETVGLGANAAKPSFTDQFAQNVPEVGFTPVKSAAANDGEIVAVTGATISSTAVTKAVNTAVEQYKQLKGGA